MREWLVFRMFPVVEGFQLWGKDLLIGFPGIVSHGISLLLDEVFQLVPFSKESMSGDGLNFEFLFPLDQFGWRAVIIGPMFFCFAIRSK